MTIGRHWRRSSIAGLLVLGMPWGGMTRTAAAGPSPHVLELFTSQGCPKCPAADRVIAELARQTDTIALSFSVDYWDYAGWKDTLAAPAFSARQRAYAAARGDRRVFTPQVIVDGLEVEPGADKAAILGASLSTAPALERTDVPIALTESDGRLRVDIGASPAAREKAKGDVGIYVLRVAREKTVEIARGRNAGRSVTYTNVVRAMRRVGDWTGTARTMDMVDLREEGEGYVVLLQEGPPDRLGAVLGAVKTPNL